MKIMERIGKRKAAVFPDPVCAQAIRSLPAITIGTAYFCTGVGLLYWDNCMEYNGISVHSVSVSF